MTRNEEMKVKLSVEGIDAMQIKVGKLAGILKEAKTLADELASMEIEIKTKDTNNLSEKYRKANVFGTINVTSDGVFIRDKRLENVVIDSISVREFGGKTIVNCDIICDEFVSAPDNSCY